MLSRNKSVAERAMPRRQATASDSDEAVPRADPKDTSELLAERLQAWKHAIKYLEAYVGATEKVHKAQAKEYERVLKTIADPLKEGSHFDQDLGGIAGLFENLRANTQGLANSHLETEKNLKGSVLPILDRLHKEIKHKSKELASGAAKSAKEVEKARNTTQKHIELLGTQTASFGAAGGKISPADDPYIIHRGVFHRLNKQVLEENNHRHDLLAVQHNFLAFEGHVVEVVQQAMEAFNQFVGGQAQSDQNLYADMLATTQRIPIDFEWNKFVERNGSMLVDPSSPDRSVDQLSFANQNHTSTQPLIEGSLERKSRNKLSMGGYSTGYYVVTPSHFLHEFKDNDNFRKDPTPELSIYLPDAIIGAPNGEKFNIKGKDVSKGISSKLSGTSEIAFKAHTSADALKWFEVIRGAAGATGPAEPYASEPSTPISPVSDEKHLNTQPPIPEDAEAGPAHPAALQTSGLISNENVASPEAATPASATVPVASEKI